MQGFQPLVQQRAFLARKPGFQCLAAQAQLSPALYQCRMFVTVRHQRREQIHLFLGPQHGGVGAAQVIKVRQQPGNARGHIKGLQHVVAHKVGQVAHRLHRHGLMEQLQRLLAHVAEAAAKMRAVGRKAIKQGDAALAQTCTQGGHGGAKVREVRRQRQRLIRHGVKALGLAKGVLHPEHLGQCHGLLETGVVEHAQNHRIVAGRAQRHWLGIATGLVSLRLVMPQHVGAQRTLARVGSGGLVVGDALCGHQKRGDGIHQSGLTRPDVAGQQAVAAMQVQRPDPLIERAPVENFQPGETKTCKGRHCFYRGLSHL